MVCPRCRSSRFYQIKNTRKFHCMDCDKYFSLIDRVDLRMKKEGVYELQTTAF